MVYLVVTVDHEDAFFLRAVKVIRRPSPGAWIPQNHGDGTTGVLRCQQHLDVLAQTVILDSASSGVTTRGLSTVLDAVIFPLTVIETGRCAIG